MTRNISSIVEEQVKRWEFEQRDRETRLTRDFVPASVITISNQIGSSGELIAQKVGEKLGVPVYDRAVVDHIATTEQVRVDVVETLDERAQSSVDDYVTNLFREKNFDQGDYLRALTKTITSLWAHGRCVIVGHGAAYIIWRKKLLAVRTVAAPHHRIRRVEDMKQLDRVAAERFMHRTDAERAAFIRKHFGANIDDPLNYDLVLNTTGLDAERAADIIVDTYRIRFPD